MSFAWIFLSVLASVVVGARHVPTAEETRARFQQAQKFYATGAYDQAIAAYDRIAQSRSRFLNMETIQIEIGDITVPVQDASLYQIGNAYLKTAEELLKRAEQAGDKGKQSEYAKQAEANFDEAIAFFLKTEAESSVPALKAQARSQAISCRYKMSDHRRVIEESRQLIEKYPDSEYVVQAMYDIGWAYYESEQYESSILAFQALVERFPSGYRADRALFQIGECYYRLEQYDKALTSYGTLVDRHAISRMSQMDILRMKREKIAGLVDETALDLVAKAHIRIGRCAAKLGRLEEAAEAYRQVIRLFSEDPMLAFDAYVELADMYYEKGDLEASIHVYRDAIDSVPDKLFRAKMQFLMGERYYESGDFEKAIEQYHVYRDGYGDVAAHTAFSPDAALYNTGRAFYELGEQTAEQDPAGARRHYTQAIATYEDLLAIYPDSGLKIAAMFNIALCYQRMGEDADIERAYGGFQQIASQYPDDLFAESALFQIARIRYTQKAYGKAAAIYQQLLSSYPESSQRDMAYFELGVCYRDANAWEEAIPAFLNVERDSDLFSKSRMVSAQLLMEQGDMERALEILGEGVDVVEDAGERTRYHFLIGKALAAKESYEEAIEVFTRVVDADDERLRESALYGRGTSYLMLEQYPEAEQDFQRLIASQDEKIGTAAQRMLGLVHVRQDRTTEAIEDYTRLLEKAEDSSKKAGYLLLLAEFYDGLGQSDRVIERGRDLLTLGIAGEKAEGQPYYLEEKAYFLIGQAYNQKNDFEAVIRTYEEALKRYPESYYSRDMLFTLGSAHFQLQDFEAAIRAFESFLRGPKNPNTLYALYYLGYAFFGQTMYERSAEILGRLADEFPNSDVTADALYRAGESNFNMRQFERATLFYQRVVEHFPESDQADDALYNLAWAFLELKRGEEAVDTFRQLANHFPESEFSATGLFTIGDYYYNEQAYSGALEAYQEVVRRYPNSDVARKVPPLLKELNEIVAYLEYEKALEPFRAALSENDPVKYREAIELFEGVIKGYPNTESVIGALSNTGICYENLKEWKKAVSVYDRVLSSYTIEEGATLPDAYRFAKAHRNWIVANRL